MLNSLESLMRKITVTLCLFLWITGAAVGQVESDSTEKDPFKNDPFFSAPISDFFKGSQRPKKDSTNRKGHTEHFVRALNEEGLDFRGLFESGPYNSNALYSVYPNLPMIHFNRVNSLFLGFKKERMQWYQNDDWLGIPRIQMHGMIGYSTGQRDWQYSIGLEKLVGHQEHVIIGGEYHDATTTNDSWRVGLNETSLTAFVGGYDYLDYYNQKGWGAYILTRSDRYFEGGIAFSDDLYSSIQRETGWALFGSGGRYRVNPPVDVNAGLSIEEVNISSLIFSASFNPKRLVLSKRFTFSLNGIAEFADPGFGTSDFDYAKYTGELISYINFEPGGVFKYRLRMSGITGDAPRFKQLYLGGVGTMRALPYKSLGEGNQMVLSNAELQFGSPQFSSGDWIDFDDFYLSLFLDSGWVDFDPDMLNSSRPFGGLDDFKFGDLKHNAGIGLGSSLIRGELAWDLNNKGRAPVFWIRLNPTF